MANLTPDELPLEGEIDRQLLRDKWSGRTSVFFNQSNSGGQRSMRAELAWEPPPLETDPAVRYRTFHGKEAVDEFIRTGVLRGGWNEDPNLPSSLFFNQGQPLWSYAGTPEAAQLSGRDRYLIGTLGDEWGNRGGWSTDKVGGIRLNEKEALIAKPSAITFPAFEQPNLIKHRLTEADLIESRNLLTRHLTSYPTLQEDGSYLGGDPDALISEKGKQGIKIWTEQLRRGLANVTSGIGAPKETYNLLYDTKAQRGGLPHPILSHRGLLIEHIDQALLDVLSARIRQNRVGGLDLSEDWSETLRKAAYKYTKRFLEPKSSRDPFTTLTMLEEAMGGLRTGGAFQTVSELENYFRTFYNNDNLEDSKTIHQRPTHLDFKALDGQKGRGIDFFSSRQKIPSLTEFVDASGNQINPNASVPSNLHTYIQPTLNAEPVSLGPIDDKSFQSPSDVSANLVKALKQPVYSQAQYHGTQAWEPWDQLRFDRMGIEGAMYSESLPLSQITAQGFGYQNYEIGEMNADISASNLKRWQLPAHSLNSNASKRPFAVWKINPNHPDGIELVHEVNNDTLPEGYKPIPTGLMNPNAISEAVARYQQETGMTPFGPTGKLAPDTGLLTASTLLNPKLESDYLSIQSLIGESTRGNPNYGKKGMLDLKAYLGGFKQMLTPEMDGEGMFKYWSDPKNVEKFKTLYSNPEFAEEFRAVAGSKLLRTVGKLGEAAAIVTTPMMARERLGAYIEDYYKKTGKSPQDIYSSGRNGPDDLTGLGLLSGVENALDVASFGNYDSWTGNEVQLRRKEIADNYSAMSDAMEPISEWQKARERRQEAIDFLMLNGYRTERTTR